MTDNIPAENRFLMYQKQLRIMVWPLYSRPRFHFSNIPVIQLLFSIIPNTDVSRGISYPIYTFLAVLHQSMSYLWKSFHQKNKKFLLSFPTLNYWKAFLDLYPLFTIRLQMKIQYIPVVQ